MEKFNLGAIKFAKVSDSVRNVLPSASVRANGKIMFSDSANVLIGYPKIGRTHFRLGELDGVFYLVPAKEGEENVFRAAKNNASFQFNDIDAIAKLGMPKKSRYTVREVKEDVDGVETVVAYSLTPKTEAEKAAEDKANAESHSTKPAAKTDEEIRSAMNRRAPEQPKKAEPSKKDLELAAKKAAKADFKKAK